LFNNLPHLKTKKVWAGLFPCWPAIINHKPILCQPYVVCTLLKALPFSLAFWKCDKFSIKNT
jgi:hypothetical protein